MHHITTREIQHSEAVQEAVRVPDAMRDGAVHQQVPQPQRHQQRRELHAVHDGSADEHGRDDGEGELVNAEGCLRHRGRELVATTGTELDAGEPHSTQVPEEGEGRRGLERGTGGLVLPFHGEVQVEVGAVAGEHGGEGQRVAQSGPEQGDQTGQREALHGRGQHILHAHAAYSIQI